MQNNKDDTTMEEEELYELFVVSKQFYEDCNNPGIEWKIPRKLVLRPSSSQQKICIKRTRNILCNLLQHLLNDESNKKLKLQALCHVIVKDVHKFDDDDVIIEIVRLAKNIEMNGILSFDISLPSPERSTKRPATRRSTYAARHSSMVMTAPTSSHTGSSIAYALAYMLPNVREINLSNTGVSHSVLVRFSEQCPFLEKVTWNNNQWNYNSNYTEISLNGSDMISANNNLKEIVMDYSGFRGYNLRYHDAIFDYNPDPENFFFCKCCKILEKVSIRRARYGKTGRIVPQRELIKFVRQAPSTLKWFRSDLTKENMNMLRSELQQRGQPRQIVLLN